MNVQNSKPLNMFMNCSERPPFAVQGILGLLVRREAQPGLQPRRLAAVRARASLLSLLYRYNCPYWGKLTLAAHTGHREGNAHRTDEMTVQRRHGMRMPNL